MYVIHIWVLPSISGPNIFRKCDNYTCVQYYDVACHSTDILKWNIPDNGRFYNRIYLKFLECQRLHITDINMGICLP